MSGIGGLMGLGGGASGSGFAGPAGTNPSDLSGAKSDVHDALMRQRQFTDALAGQNGLGNQNQVYSQLQDIAAGRGPNPAQAQLAEATRQNVANQAALMASQRGAGQNAGLIARQASMRGGDLQQQAANQAATLQAQQSMNAINSAGNIANTQVGQQQAGQNALAQTALGNQANTYSLQGNLNNANAGLAGGSQKNQAGMLGGLMNGAGGMASMFGFGSGPGAAAGGAGEAGLMAGGAGDAVGAGSGMADVVGPASDAMMLAAEGGEVDPNGAPDVQSQSVAATNLMNPQQSSGPQSAMGKTLAMQDVAIKPGMGGAENIKPAAGAKEGDVNFDWGGAGKGALKGAGMGASIGSFVPVIGTAIGAVGGGVLGGLMGGFNHAEGGEVKVPAMVSPGEQYIPPKELEKVKKGANPLKVGERIPGKPKHPGNDYRNDTVPKTLEAGGVVIPNKVMQSRNPHWEAMKFVRAHMAKGGRVLPPKGKK